MSIVQDGTTTTTSGSVTAGDASFEQVALAAGGFAYDPTGSAWAFAGSAGVASNGSAFTGSNPSAPSGTQVAFVQNQGSLSQTMTGFAAGSYHISFSAAQRAGFVAQDPPGAPGRGGGGVVDAVGGRRTSRCPRRRSPRRPGRTW